MKINIKYEKNLNINLIHVLLTQLEKKSCFGKSSLSIAVLVIILRFFRF